MEIFKASNAEIRPHFILTGGFHGKNEKKVTFQNKLSFKD